MIKPMKPKDNLKLFRKRHSHCWYSLKLNGIRVHCIVTSSGLVQWYSATNGKPLNNFSSLDQDVIKYLSPIYMGTGVDKIILDGEMTAGSFSGLMSQFRRLKDMDPSHFVFNVFDILYLEHNLDERLSVLAQCKNQDQVKTHPHYFLPTDEAIEVAYDAIHQECEGGVLKAPNSPYVNGKSSLWVRIKKESTLDVKVVGAFQGVGKYKGKLGAFVCKAPNGKHFNVGTGYTDAERHYFWFNNPPEIIEIKFMEFSKHGIPIHPVFVRVREDK